MMDANRQGLPVILAYLRPSTRAKVKAGTSIVAASGWWCKGGRAGLGRWTRCPGPEPVKGRVRAVEALDVRVDWVPGPGPVDAGPRLTGIRGRSQRKGQTF